jgi:RNA polymerase subunit RPABC4/transcription elongation factor Spt4
VDRHGNKIQAVEGAVATAPPQAAGQFVGLKLKTCPKCAEKIQIDALICRHCGQEFTSDEVAAVKQQAQETAARAEQKANAGVRRTWGWIFSIIGGLVLAVTTLLLIIMIAYSVSPEAANNAATSAMSLIIPFLCVPLPMLIIGGLLFYFGRKWVRAASAVG